MTTKFHMCFWLVCVLMAGCASVTNSTVVATATEIPMPTNASSPLPIKTATPIPTNTPTTVFTLEPKQAEDALKDLLWNNSDCLAPCFMGLIPSQTTLGKAKNLFTHLGLDLELTSSEGNNEFYAASHKFESGSSFRVRLKVQSGVVKDLDIPITLLRGQNGISRQEWSSYWPDTLIRQYGTPAKANFFVDRGPTPSYAMDLYFDTADLIVEYYSYDLGSNLKICPLNNQMEFIRIWVGKEPASPPLDTVHLTNATSMSMEEFTRLMTGDPTNACFLLKNEAFP